MYYVTSWVSQGGYAGDPEGGWTLILDELGDTPDLGYDPGSRHPLVPLFGQDEVAVINLGD